MIFKEKFPYLLNLFPSVYGPNGFMHPLDANESCKDLNEGTIDGQNINPNKTSNKEPNDGLDNGDDLLTPKELTLVFMKTVQK